MSLLFKVYSNYPVRCDECDWDTGTYIVTDDEHHYCEYCINDTSEVIYELFQDGDIIEIYALTKYTYQIVSTLSQVLSLVKL